MSAGHVSDPRIADGNRWQVEENLREKKVESDLKDLSKMLVAFANSVARVLTGQSK